MIFLRMKLVCYVVCSTWMVRRSGAWLTIEGGNHFVGFGVDVNS